MDPNPPSSVHSIATSGTAPNPVPYAVIQRQRSGLEFIAAQELYRAFDAVEGTTREKRLLECRQNAWFVRSADTGLVRVSANHCRLRWCPLCARSRAGYMTAKIKEWFPDTHRPKLLTLTVKSSQASLSDQIKHIYRSFRELRRSRFWKELVYGGIWFFQITYNKHKKQWHPHIHVLLDSEFIPFEQLKQKWYYYTADSDIVDIRPIFNSNEVANYVARYASRPHDLSTLPVDAAKDLMSVMYGKRMCGSFGTGKKIALSPYKEAKSDEWRHLGSWSLVHRLAATDDAAKKILLAYHTNQPLEAGLNIMTYERFLSGEDVDYEYKPRLDPIPPPPTLFD